MKSNPLALGTLSILALSVQQAIAQTPEAVPITQPPPVQAEPATSAGGPGIIVPLSPPESLSGPTIEQKAVFGNFQYDDSVSPRSFDVTLRSMFEHYQTSGPGRNNSFYEPGTHSLHDLEINTRNTLGGFKTELNALLRYTDSSRHDLTPWSLQRFQFIAADAKNHLTLGDYYATLSQYSLNQAIKGIGYQRNVSDSTSVKVLAGTFAPRWDHLWGRQYDETLRRDVMGLRIQNAGPKHRIGLNLVHASDHHYASAPTTFDSFRQTLPAVDWEYRTDGGIRLSGEHAYANTKRVDPAGNKTQFSGSANRLDADGSMKNFRWRWRSERVSPDFYTMGGGAVVDRLRYYLRGDYQFNKVWGMYLANDWYRDNLNGQLAATTRTNIPEAGVTARGLFGRRNLDMSVGLRQRRVETDDPNYSKRTSDRIYVSLADRFGEVSLRGEVEALLNRSRDSLRNYRDNDDYLYRFTADSRHLFRDGRYDFRPYFTLERQTVEDPMTGKKAVMNGAIVDFRLIAPHNMTYALNFERRYTTNRDPAIVNNSLKRYGLSVTARPSVLRGSSIRAEAGNAHYAFTGRTNDYRERYVRVLLDIPFSSEK